MSGVVRLTHGGKFRRKAVTKCGLTFNQVEADGDLIMPYAMGIAKVNCRACLALHKEGKC